MTHQRFGVTGRSAGDPVDPGWRRIVEPQSDVVAPVTVAELSEFLEDPCPPDSGTQRHSLLNQYILWATRQAIEFMDREMEKRDIVVRFDAYPRAHSTRGRLAEFSGGHAFFVILPRVPIHTFDKVEEVDSDGNTEAISSDDYDVDTVSAPARLNLDDPPGRGDLAYFAGIRVHYTAGYDTVPEALKLGVLQHAGYLYEHRGEDLSRSLTKSGAADIYDPFRIRIGL